MLLGFLLGVWLPQLDRPKMRSSIPECVLVSMSVHTRLQTCIQSIVLQAPPTHWHPLRALNFNMCGTPSHVIEPLVSISIHVSDKQTRPWSGFHTAALEELHCGVFSGRTTELNRVYHLTVSEVNRWSAAHMSDWRTNTDQNNIIQALPANSL